MKINELPVKLLKKIFTYLPTHKKVSLVSRRFYEVACKFNASLTFDRNLFKAENVQRLLSIMRSNRKIWNVEINLRQLIKLDVGKLLCVIWKFSATIKHLTLQTGFVKMSDFLEILSSVPNAEELVIDDLRICQSYKRQPEKSKNEDLNLKHLKILHLYDCEGNLEVVFNRLPTGVLTEFRWCGGHLPILNTLFLRQTSMKKLLFSCTNNHEFPAQIFDNLELESLEIWHLDIQAMALSTQTKLKSLTLQGTNRVDEHLMEVAANRLTELEELNWDISKTPVNDFVNIERLKNLNHLNLTNPLSSRPDILDKLIQLDNSRITTLEIKAFDDLTTHQIQTLAKSSPKLKVLNACSCLKWQQITEVLKNFNFVECLSLGKSPYGGSYENYLNQNDCTNAKLRELSFQIENYETPVLTKLIADFPNLKKLRIGSRTELTSSQFRLILNGFTKLELLELDNWDQLTIGDFKYMRNNRKNLHLLWLRGINDAFVDEHLDDLQVMFKVVKYPYPYPMNWLLLKM